MKDLKEYAQSQLAEQVSYSVTGFNDIADTVSSIEDEEPEFDGDSYCPYYHEQADVIANYESEFGKDACEFDGEAKYKASEFQQAQTAYAYAVAQLGFDSFFNAAKQELIDAIEEFETDAQSQLETDQHILLQLSTACQHGWASHNRELSNGTMIFESRQLDGCNGMEREINGIYISCCIDPANEKKAGE